MSSGIDNNSLPAEQCWIREDQVLCKQSNFSLLLVELSSAGQHLTRADPFPGLLCSQSELNFTVQHLLPAEAAFLEAKLLRSRSPSSSDNNFLLFEGFCGWSGSPLNSFNSAAFKILGVEKTWLFAVWDRVVFIIQKVKRIWNTYRASHILWFILLSISVFVIFISNI